jgi:hypothetical protein
MTKPRPPKSPRCKWCEQGVRLTGSDHWIVKSIFPARIKIVPCKLAAAARAEVES